MDMETLIGELEACAFFADGTRNGVLVPLADFTRRRLARALAQAGLMLEATQRVEHGTLPGIASIADERFRQIDDAKHSQADDIGRSHELIAAAEAHLQIALLGPDAWHDPDGAYTPPSGWPWPDHAWHPSDNPVDALATAGALIAAAIDALGVPLAGRTRAQRRDEHLVRRTTT